MHADYREWVDPNNIFSHDDHDYYHHVKDEVLDDYVYDEAEEPPHFHRKHHHP